MSAERQPAKSFTLVGAAVNIGLCDGDALGEVNISWPGLYRGVHTVKLTAWCGSWRTLMACGDVVAWLASVDGRDVTPAEVCTALASMGYVDITPVER